MPRTLALLLAAVLALGLWVLLVVVAVGHGRDARRGGGTTDWVLTALVSVAAAGVLYLVTVLLPRAWAAWTGLGRAGSVPGRHRTP